MRGQSCYVEVTLGCSKSVSDNPLQSNSDARRNFPTNHVPESAAVGRGDKKGSPDQLPAHEKTFIYPAEAVLVPVLHTSFARSSLKRYMLLQALHFCVVQYALGSVPQGGSRLVGQIWLIRWFPLE